MILSIMFDRIALWRQRNSLLGSIFSAVVLAVCDFILLYLCVFCGVAVALSIAGVWSIPS